MNRIFRTGAGFAVPDGTMVHSVIDPTVLRQAGTAWVEELGLAGGTIPPRTVSKIHVHPVVTQVTYVLEGHLTVRMKDHEAGSPYSLDLAPAEAVVTQSGTFFQLLNKDSAPCRVLYIVSPTFLFECNAEGDILYNDAIVLEEGWERLATQQWSVSQLANLETIRAQRAAAKARMQL